MSAVYAGALHTAAASVFIAIMASCTATVPGQSKPASAGPPPRPRVDSSQNADTQATSRKSTQGLSAGPSKATAPDSLIPATGAQRQSGPVAGDYDGPQRFPVLPMRLAPREDRVPLIGDGSVRARVDASLMLESDRRDKYSQVLCNYGPFPDGGPEWGILFWKGKRPALAPEVVERLQRRNPMLAGTMIDVSIPACPRTWGLALAIANRTAAPSSISDDADLDIAKAKAGGLRFANQLMRSALTDDTTSRLMRGDTPSLSQLKQYDQNKQGYTSRAGGFDGITGAASPEIAGEIDKLISLGHELLTCSYGYQDPKHGIIIRDGSNFWLRKRPAKISEALAKRIESSRFPLVDVALQRCPKFLTEAIAFSFGTTGQWALEAQAKAAALAARRAGVCDRLTRAEGLTTSTAKPSNKEPTAGEMCQSLQDFLEEKFETAGNSIVGSMHPEVTVFEKQVCKSNGKLGFQCSFRTSYTVKLRGGAMQKIQGMPTELSEPLEQYTRVFVSSAGSWSYIPEVQSRTSGSSGGNSSAGSSSGRDTMADRFVERNRDNMQNYYDRSQGQATGTPIQPYNPSRRY